MMTLQPLDAALHQKVPRALLYQHSEELIVVPNSPMLLRWRRLQAARDVAEEPDVMYSDTRSGAVKRFVNSDTF